MGETQPRVAPIFSARRGLARAQPPACGVSLCSSGGSLLPILLLPVLTDVRDAGPGPQCRQGRAFCQARRPRVPEPGPSSHPAPLHCLRWPRNLPLPTAPWVWFPAVPIGARACVASVGGFWSHTCLLLPSVWAADDRARVDLKHLARHTLGVFRSCPALGVTCRITGVGEPRCPRPAGEGLPPGPCISALPLASPLWFQARCCPQVCPQAQRRRLQGSSESCRIASKWPDHGAGVTWSRGRGADGCHQRPWAVSGQPCVGSSPVGCMCLPGPLWLL